ncbi:mRNA interferase MazF [Ruaniaceae bacterium KH17]|nr:mRNA interferase MazF [Ruaniaceae bacterium KH17]
MVVRGAVYRIDLGRARGNEQQGKRLGVVVSPTDIPLSVVTVIPTSTSARPATHRPDVTLAGRETRVMIDQIRSIEVDCVMGEPVDYVPRKVMDEIDDALARYLSLDRE